MVGGVERVFVLAETGTGGATVVVLFFEVLQATIIKAEIVSQVILIIFVSIKLKFQENNWCN